jgi:hypothetical protein
MTFRKIFIPLGLLAMIVLGYQAWGWQGVAMVAGAMVMWLLLHFNRMMQVMRRAYNQPKGYVASAVMLQAKLKPGLSLMDVMARTRSMGEQISPEQAQPEQFRWTDSSGASVHCSFVKGRLAHWDFQRPADPAEVAGSPAP